MSRNIDDDTTASLIAKVKSQALRIAKAEVKAIEVTTQAVEPPTTTWTPDADLEFDAADEDLTGSVCSALSTANVSTIERGMLSRGSTHGSYVSAPSRTPSDAAGSTPSGESTPSWLSWALSEAHESRRPSWLVTPPDMKPEEQFRPSWLTTPPASEPPAFPERPSAAHRPSEAQLHAEVAELREALERMSEALQTECRSRESLENEVARQGELLLETRELLVALEPSSLPSGGREADEDGDPAVKPAAEPAPVLRLTVGEEEAVEAEQQRACEAEKQKESVEAEQKKESDARLPDNQPNQPIETPNKAMEQPVIRRLEPKEEAALLSALHAAMQLTMQQAAAEDEAEAEEEAAEARFEIWEAAEAEPAAEPEAAEPEDEEHEAEPEVESASDSPPPINLSSLMSSPLPQQPTFEPIQEPSSGNAFIDFFVNMSPFQQRAEAVEMASPRQSVPRASPSSRQMPSTATTAAFTTASISAEKSAPRSRPPPDFGGTLF